MRVRPDAPPPSVTPAGSPVCRLTASPGHGWRARVSSRYAQGFRSALTGGSRQEAFGPMHLRSDLLERRQILAQGHQLHRLDSIGVVIHAEQVVSSDLERNETTGQLKYAL